MNEMQQGLGGITAGAMPRMTESAVGASKQSMEQIMEAARKMSDAQLADVLMGKSMEVPQFVAMSEAMGRKQLRTALQGAQAQQQAQQPSVREQLLAETVAQSAMPAQPALPEEQGIGALPAPNMEQMDSMAGGGIVAFDDGGLTEGEQDRLDFLRPFAAAGDVIGLPVSATLSGISGARIPFTDTKIPEFYTAGTTPLYDMIRRREAEGAASAEQEAADIEALDQALNEAPKEVKPVDTTGGAPSTLRQPAPTPVVDLEEVTAEAPPRRFAQFESDGSALEKSLEEQREQTQGEFLMQIGASLLGSPTLAEGLSSGVQKALPMLAANKREAAKLRQDARDFQFNVAKAQEAAELGDADLAYKYEALAADKAYKAGLLATKGTTGALTSKDVLKAFQDAKKVALDSPIMAQRYANMNEAERTAFDQQIYADVMRSIQAVTGGGMMTQGGLPPSLQQAIEAEYQRRTSGE